MSDDTAQPAPEQGAILDYTDIVGRFLVVSPTAQFFALERFLVAADISSLSPRVCSVNLHALTPLFDPGRPSKIILVLHPGDRANAYFLTDIAAGPLKKTIRVLQQPDEIIANALSSNAFPVLMLTDLQRAAAVSRKRRTPLSVRVQFMELHEHVPENWRDAIKALFRVNAKGIDGKGDLLSDRLQTLREAIKHTMVDKFLIQCVWLNERTNQIGRLSESKLSEMESRYGFSPAVLGDAHFKAFTENLACEPDGAYVRHTGFANVMPSLVKGLPWCSPTLHVYDEVFRGRYGLDEHYSLYKGLRALCAIGAPVLMFKPDALETAVPVALLRPKGRDTFMRASVCEFPLRGVVWNERSFD